MAAPSLDGSRERWIVRLRRPDAVERDRVELVAARAAKEGWLEPIDYSFLFP